MSAIDIQKLLQEIDVLKQKYHTLAQKHQLSSLTKRARTHLTYHSNALEGNTLTEQQTSLIINDGISVAGKKIIELQEANNHAQAIDMVQSRLAQKKINDMGEKEVCQIHETIWHNIQDAYAGVYRNQAVRIAGSSTILPNYAKVPTLMQEREKSFQTSSDDPLLLAIQAHYDLVSIHPFIDGNGRTARLFMNAILLLDGYPLVFVDVSQREAYIHCLECAQNQGDYESYCLFMLGCVYDSLLLYLDA